jgi:predicted ABC-type ATPase
MKTVYIVGGCNGAGKSTVAKLILPTLIQDSLYVNADEIAANLIKEYKGNREIQAGRIMLQRIREYSSQGIDFAFETTLSSKSFFPILQSMRRRGYQLGIVYLFLNSPNLALHRVAERVRAGGHSIPADVIRRRYDRGLQNFRSLYLPLVDVWFAYDNSEKQLNLIARGGRDVESKIYIPDIWNSIITSKR